jgi:hypothetical protein
MSLNEAVTPSRAAPCLPVRAQVGLQDATGARQASRLGSFLRCGSRKTRFPRFEACRNRMPGCMGMFRGVLTG